MSEKGIPKVRVRFKAKSKQLPFPRSVRVGCYTYAVVPEGHQDTIAVGFHGATNHVGMKIQVDVSTSAQQTANTFLHEVIHAINYVYGIGGQSSEEEVATYLANGLCAFWQDNPAAAQWWAQLNSGKK